MTQSQFAEALGVNQAYISSLEKGKNPPSKSLIKFMCAKFKINENWLLKGEGPMKISPEEEIKEALKYYDISELLSVLQNTNIKVNNKNLSFSSELWTLPKITNQEDLDLYNMMKWFKDTWENGDYKVKGWLAIQFEKAFPEYKESLEKKPRVVGESEVTRD